MQSWLQPWATCLQRASISPMRRTRAPRWREHRQNMVCRARRCMKASASVAACMQPCTAMISRWPEQVLDGHQAHCSGVQDSEARAHPIPSCSGCCSWASGPAPHGRPRMTSCPNRSHSACPRRWCSTLSLPHVGGAPRHCQLHATWALSALCGMLSAMADMLPGVNHSWIARQRCEQCPACQLAHACCRSCQLMPAGR